ncbi:MAG: ABC transporter ATP-binding protein, partial [Draconibacterium sp.]|nr:ABC transporter ATP-binding protein [Draconibacterium sp.]
MKEFIKLLRRFIHPYKTKLIWNIIFNILSAIFGVFSFILMKPTLEILFDQKELILSKPELSLNINSLTDTFNFYVSKIISESGSEKALIFVSIFLITAVLFKTGFYYLANYILVFIRNGVVRDIRSLIYKKILKLPLGFYSDERKGDIMARITGDVTEVENSVMNSIEMMIKNPILIIVSVTVMIYMSWSLTIFVFIMFPIAGFIIGKIGKSLKRESRRGQNKMGEILSIVEEDLSGLRVIKSFNAENKAQQRFDKENNNYLGIMNQLMWRRYLAHPTSEFLGTVVIMFVLWYGGNLILNEKSTLDASGFIVYLVLFYSIINPAKAFSTALYSIEKGLASMERIDDILLAKSEIVDKKNAIEINSFDSEITYEDVSFAYNS